MRREEGEGGGVASGVEIAVALVLWIVRVSSALSLIRGTGSVFTGAHFAPLNGTAVYSHYY